MKPAGSLGGKQVVGSSTAGEVPVDGNGNAAPCSNIQLDFDLNVGVGFDSDGEGGLHGVDLNEGVNYILHEGLDLNEGAAVEGENKRELFDLNQEAAMDEDVESSEIVKWFDLNVEPQEDESSKRQLPIEGGNYKGKEIIHIEDSPPRRFEPVHLPPLQMAPPRLNFQRPSQRRRGRNIGDYASLPPTIVMPPPKVELPPSSVSLDLGGASVLDFLSIYTFLRSFSTLLFLSPFEAEEFAASLICNDSTPLLDAIHLSLLRAIRPCLKRLSGEGLVTASACLRSLNWDLLDSITWPVYLVEYLLLHKPKHILSLDLSEFGPFQSDYYSMPSSAKLLVLQQLCDDLNESEEYGSELSKRALMAESGNSKMKYFASKGEKWTEDVHHDVQPADDGNGDECYLCKMDGIMICCDACPAAIHARCVGVVSSLLPEGQWICPECTLDKGKPYDLANSIRGTELLATDHHGRHYYNICDYLLVSDSCGDDKFSFLWYKGSGLLAVVVALESSYVLHGNTIRAIRRHWNSSHDGGATSTSATQESLGTHYVNMYEFSFIASSLSKELTSQESADDARTSEQIMTRQLKVIIRDKHAMFSWSNIYNLNLYLNSKKEKCGWCFTCRDAEEENDCLCLRSNNNRAIEGFTSEALRIQSRNGKKKHLIDVICQVMWIESRLQGLLQGIWSDPRHSDQWRRNAMEVADVASLNKLVLQLESSLGHRTLSAEWRKHVDTAITKGSASHFVRKFMRVSLATGSSKTKRKCSKQEVTRLPKVAIGTSLFWWRGGRISRELFTWKVLPNSLASNVARRGGFKKIVGVHYSDSVEYAKRMKFTAWRAAVERSRSVEQLALQVRELDANIKWNDIENINVVPKRERESKKCAKAFKNALIRKKICEGGVVKYLIHFKKCRSTSLPNIVVKHGSLHPDSTSKRRKYWLEESHIPLHLLKEYEEKMIVRAANRRSTVGEPHEGAQAATNEPLKKNGFDYLFERAERLEMSTRSPHYNEDVSPQIQN